MNVSDYIANFIVEKGMRHVFLVSGGGMMFLLDSVGRHPKLEPICNHHEQASAMAAVAYSKENEMCGVCYVTSGCGGTNALTGLLQAYQDSTPCLFISGQVKRKETTELSGLPLRQFGVQEADIVSVVKPLSKYAIMLKDATDIRYECEKAYYLATSGRPGPVWLDIPLDIQGETIDLNTLKSFYSVNFQKDYKEAPTDKEYQQVKKLIEQAERPVVLAGNGIRLAHALPEFKAFVERYHLPVVGTYMGIDFLTSDHPLFVGRSGNKGTRPGNLALQNADLIISMGCRLHTSVTGHEYELFGREAKLLVLDIDSVEHQKKTVKIDTFVNCDLKDFFACMPVCETVPNQFWLNRCLEWKTKYSVFLPEYRAQKKVNLYYFTERLSALMSSDAVVVSDAGSAYYVISQAIQISDKQRYITSGAQAEMGFTVPGVIGVSFSRNRGEVIGVTGEGSLQMNIQELQTIVHYKLPVKLFIWNNEGYLSIRATQNKFFDGRLVGTGPESGVSFPDLQKVAKAYGIPYVRINDSDELDDGIKKTLAKKGPVICEVMCSPNQPIIPNVSALKREDGSLVSKPLEDMFPYLDRDEFNETMVIKPL